MSTVTQDTADLTAELDKILDKTFSDLRKRLTTMITRREKRLLKPSRASTTKKEKPTPAPTRRTKYRSSSSHSESSS